ncbi:hypothetical protein B2J86_10730 [Acidovorax sp. SRB_14]|uniref:DUF1045 domain-containing protein n=1 Tax=Acidovorax sp. SRB_14 TaxID=1962699 RepID=UPI00156393B9|nr:DUF1045 domain-containing protein [Acidovorax sp. SRB_14]NMM81389.1 hypothetical protein [Acidovorax sp. SRB_14]
MTISNTPPFPVAAHRYAVYFAPEPATLAWRAGSHWVGRCAARGQPLPQLDIDGVTRTQLEQLTAAPRRYGWHATLKAPFALAPDVDWLTLQHAVRSLAKGLRRFQLPPLQVQRVDDFLALVPMAQHAANADIQAATDACVTQLQPLSAALSDQELARRRAAGLTPRQDELLRQWGYPFVFEEYRFHMSLTGALTGTDPATVARVHDAAEQFFADLPALQFSSLALFAEPTPGADFALVDHVGLGQ